MSDTKTDDTAAPEEKEIDAVAPQEELTEETSEEENAEETEETPEEEENETPSDPNSTEESEIEDSSELEEGAAEDSEKENITEEEPANSSPEQTTPDERTQKTTLKDKLKKLKNLITRERFETFFKWMGIISIPLLIILTTFVLLKPSAIHNVISKEVTEIRTVKTTAIQWTAEELEMIRIVGQTLTETEKIWSRIFKKKGGHYKKPDVTIFTGKIHSACSKPKKDEEIPDHSSLGTFYCPEERRIYIDLSLHQNLKDRLDIPGEFAQGYIVAHEIGHHIQNLAKISEQIPAARQRLDAKKFEMVLQRMELQADCFAGIWARYTAENPYNVTAADFPDALNAVSRFSRNHLKEKEKNDDMPDSFTYASSRLRLRWFNIGFNEGTFDSCDTFIALEL